MLRQVPLNRARLSIPPAPPRRVVHTRQLPTMARSDDEYGTSMSTCTFLSPQCPPVARRVACTRGGASRATALRRMRHGRVRSGRDLETPRAQGECVDAAPLMSRLALACFVYAVLTFCAMLLILRCVLYFLSRFADARVRVRRLSVQDRSYWRCVVVGVGAWICCKFERVSCDGC